MRKKEPFVRPVPLRGKKVVPPPSERPVKEHERPFFRQQEGVPFQRPPASQGRERLFREKREVVQKRRRPRLWLMARGPTSVPPSTVPVRDYRKMVKPLVPPLRAVFQEAPLKGREVARVGKEGKSPVELPKVA